MLLNWSKMRINITLTRLRNKIPVRMSKYPQYNHQQPLVKLVKHSGLVKQSGRNEFLRRHTHIWPYGRYKFHKVNRVGPVIIGLDRLTPALRWLTGWVNGQIYLQDITGHTMTNPWTDQAAYLAKHNCTHNKLSQQNLWVSTYNY